MVLIRAQTAITFRQTAVTAYFRSTQLLLFAFARQRMAVINDYKLRRYSVVLHARNV